MITGIIFDFDGVIVDSELIYIESLQGYLKTLGVDVDAEEISYVIGQNVRDIASDIVEQFDLDLSVEEFVAKSSAYYQKLNKETIYPLLPGVKEFIQSCKDKGIRMCVASSSGFEYLIRILNSHDLLKYFEFVLSGRDLKHSKPDPEIYNISANRLGIPKNELLIIEDSIHGVRAGMASGIRTVAYKGAKFVQDTSFAEHEIKEFKELQI